MQPVKVKFQQTYVPLLVTKSLHQRLWSRVNIHLCEIVLSCSTMGAVEEQRFSKSRNAAPIQGYWSLISRTFVTSAEFEAAISLPCLKRVGAYACKRHLGPNSKLAVHHTARKNDNIDHFAFPSASSSTPKGSQPRTKRPPLHLAILNGIYVVV